MSENAFLFKTAKDFVALFLHPNVVRNFFENFFQIVYCCQRSEYVFPLQETSLDLF